ncbi:tetratricopeptide repeat protein [Coprobacter tertius]|uniref:Lipoprotein n=1 Tax=Coprobacter tertius TaxID=2944915 RepID=A0ABT1MEN7_9BACT|nr:tetratricopeptide repeat protein [Coprobacter tertius]MCP9611100.1 hypothetical protein [Coprobacter tertius]
MKKLLWAVVLSFSIISCGKTDKKAEAQYKKAEALYEQGDYNQAKQQIDSIKVLYPKAFDQIKKGMILMCRVNLKESERNLVYIDSLLPLKKAEVDRLKKDFFLSKDEKYEETGHYVYKSEKNNPVVNRSYVRAQVSEDGIMEIASVYFGPAALHHESMRVEAPDGSYAMTKVVPYDGARNFRFVNDGNTTEVVTYKGEQMIAVAELIYNTPGKIKVSYEGKRPYSFTLDDRSRKMINASYELAMAMKSVKELTREQAINNKGCEILRRQISDLESGKEQ